MCKYCAFLKNEDLDFESISSESTDLNVGIAKFDVGEDIFLYNSKNGDPELNAEIYNHRGDGESFFRFKTPINYCPICGERLRDVLVNMEES